MTHLLDGNVLVALVVADHEHHDAATSWFGRGRPFATCPITQGTLLRMLLRAGMAAPDVWTVLDAVTRRDAHAFWSDELDYGSIEPRGVIGHRQVTDAYLAQLARFRSGRLATFDRGLAQSHGDVADLLS